MKSELTGNTRGRSGDTEGHNMHIETETQPTNLESARYWLGETIREVPARIPYTDSLEFIVNVLDCLLSELEAQATNQSLVVTQ